MAWHRTGAKPLSEPMLALYTDAYMCQLTSVSVNDFTSSELNGYVYIKFVMSLYAGPVYMQLRPLYIDVGYIM